MLLDRKQIPWATGAAVVALLSAGAYWIDASRRLGGASGGSAVGLTLGGGALGIMLFCAALSLKRKAPHWRLGRAQTWLRAHVWLGLLTVALVALHSAFAVGGPLTTWLWALLALVTVSGAFGVLLQQFIPRLLLHSTPGETVAQQLGRQMENLQKLAEQVVVEYAGSLDAPAPPWPPVVIAAPAGAAPAPTPAPPSTGAEGAAAAVAVAPPKPAPSPAQPAPPAGGEPVRRFYLDYLKAFLAGHTTALRSTTRTESLFGALRTMTPPHIHPGIAELQEMCARRRLLVRQRHLMFVLHVWLVVHVPASWALILLTLVHAVSALQYGGL